MFDDIDVRAIRAQRSREQTAAAIDAYYRTFLDNYRAGNVSADGAGVRVLVYSLRHRTKAVETSHCPAGTTDGCTDYVPDPLRHKGALAERLRADGIRMTGMVTASEGPFGKYTNYYAVCEHRALSACSGQLGNVYRQERDRLVKEVRQHMLKGRTGFYIHTQLGTAEVLREMAPEIRAKGYEVRFDGATLSASLH